MVNKDKYIIFGAL